MQYVYEFEIFPSEGRYVALPYDLEGGTEGYDFADACKMAADWLQLMADNDFTTFGVPAEPSFDNEPKHPKGRTVVVAASSTSKAVA